MCVYRCRECHSRFHLRSQSLALSPAAKGRNDSRKRRLILRRREFYVYAAALLAFVVLAFVITRERQD
jgi:hypothetical protein